MHHQAPLGPGRNGELRWTQHGPDDTIGPEVTEQLEITSSERSGWTVLTATGEIDLASVDYLQSALDAAFAKVDPQVVIDLSAVSFLDSTGLRALIGAHRRGEDEGAKVALVVNGGPVERLLEITGVDASLNIHPTLESVTG